MKNRTMQRDLTRGFRLALGGWVACGVVLMSSVGLAAEDRDDYLTRIKPMLRQRCFACHGALKQKSGLRLDTVASMIAGGDSGAAIARGDASKSLLLERVSATDVAERMPPEHEGEPLTTEQIALLQAWIAAGAPAPADEQPDADPKDHWAFRPIVRPDVPAVGNQGWVKNPIDAFLARQHEQHGLAPQPEAPRIVLLRRLYLDLIGLPPTAEEISHFEEESIRNPQSAIRNLVDRLLDDPRHGERWARHWMDIWRYSDWWGLGAQLRNSQQHIWHWRDWIVESLNRDTPYDEMLRLMLAADELYPNDLDKLRATGLLARNYFLFNRNQWMEETVEHVSKGLLGLTLNCAKCHDHKYDPIAQADFYRMRAFFEPYHVRLDVVPGETDLARDGIPRVYDGLLDEPTYRFIRGQEKSPDKSTVIAPGVPKLLAFEELAIEPVSLPAEAWQPARRPWVLENHLAAARKRVETAESQLRQATEQVAQAKALAAKTAEAKKDAPQQPETPATAFVADDFQTLDKQRWQLFAGQWAHQPGSLSQKKDGATRAVLRLTEKPPQDFDATVRFTILGGSMWRSVCLSFDAADGDPTRDTDAAYHEQNVYASAYAGGPKIQAAYNDGGKWNYPPAPAMRATAVELNRQHTLRVQVRDTLINATFDGQPMIAWRTPLARRDGFMQVTTFDVLAVIHEIKVSALPKDAQLREPSDASASPAAAATDVAGAQAAEKVAEANVAVARAELTSVERRAEALQAGEESDRQAKTIAAVKAERLAAVAKARHAVAVAEQSLLRAAADKKNEAGKAVKAAQAALEKAIAAAEAEVKPTDTFTQFVGAKWTPTRFRSSGSDDPTVEFSPQSTGRRTALASWITDRRNPLTARVAANHIWMRHMGQPLVPSVFDFGRNGIRPTHPELLDWLAAELIDNGWSMKHLHRVIVDSAAYRMSSSVAGGQANTARDPDNRYWWRRVPIRLESQVVRDSILALAGTLDPTMGGPPVQLAQQAASTRRSIYFFHSNNDRNLFLTTFDEALVKECYRREQSIVPQQALALINSQLVLDGAQQIAKRLSADAADDDAFIRAAFTVLLGITASDAELAASQGALEAWRQLPNGSADNARANLVWALINHNDFVTLR